MPGKFPRRIRRYSSDRERPVRRITSGNRSNRVGHSMSESRDAPLRRKREQNIPSGYVARLFIQYEREVYANRALGFFAQSSPSRHVLGNLPDAEPWILSTKLSRQSKPYGFDVRGVFAFRGTTFHPAFPSGVELLYPLDRQLKYGSVFLKSSDFVLTSRRWSERWNPASNQILARFSHSIEPFKSVTNGSFPRTFGARLFHSARPFAGSTRLLRLPAPHPDSQPKRTSFCGARACTAPGCTLHEPCSSRDARAGAQSRRVASSAR
jgi:hypothetical protein